MNTMGQILPNWRITLAVLFSIVLIGGSFLLAHSVESPQVAQASTETALLQAIATKDSSGDGLPDWEKSLYGIPLNASTTDYFNLGMTDGEAVAKGLIVPKAVADIPTTASASSSLSADGLPAPQTQVRSRAHSVRNSSSFTSQPSRRTGRRALE